MKLMIACRAIDSMAGGVERQATSLANEMVKRGHNVCLFTCDHKGAKSFYYIDPNVKWYQLGLGNPQQKANLGLRLKRMKRVRCIMSEFKPDVILGFQHGMFLSLRLYTLGMGIPVVAAERESPYRFDFLQEGKRRNFIFQTFRLASNITVQCASYVDAYPLYLRKKITVIPNPVVPAHITTSEQGEIGTEKTLLCVGRLTYQKNQLVMIDAFAKISNENPNWILVMAGEGEHREIIEQRVKAYNLQHKIRLLGAVKDVASLYTNSHALCISSRWEGFPNVLGEALAHGLPAIGYKGCGGVRDLIQHECNGLLAEGNENVKTLAQAMNMMLQDDQLRHEMRGAAMKSVERYLPHNIYNLWESFLEKVSKPRSTIISSIFR